MTAGKKSEKIRRKPGKLISSAGAAFLLSLTLLFAGPSYLYFRNILQIPYYYTDMFWNFAVYALLAGAVLTTILLLLKGEIHQRAAAGFFALGLLFWIQGTFLVWDYGVLDGRRIFWRYYVLEGLVDSTIWIAVLTIVLIKARFFYRHIAWASLALIVIQGGGLAAEILPAPEEPEWKSYSVGYNDETMFEFSREENVIILVLDMFQPDLFQEIIEEDPEYGKLFDGFTFYRNAIGGFPTTYPSVTFILSGRQYDNSIPIQDFIKDTFLTASIPLALKESGYQVDLHALVSPRAIYFSEEVASNAGPRAGRTRVERKVDRKQAAGELLELTLFRYVPHVFKSGFYFVPYIETRDSRRILQDLIFYNSLVANTVVSSENSVFKFYHLQGAHPPYRLNSELRQVELPQDRFGYKEQGKAALKIAGELISQLKKNDVYDNSLIFIVTDHGNPWASHGIKRELLGRTDEAVDYDIVEERVISSAISLLLAKPFNSTGSLKISDAPVTLGDIPQTIASELELDREFPGRSILSVGETEEREREFFYYVWDDGWDHSYLPDIEVFTVNGHGWLPGSWSPTDTILEPGM